nr:MAG TPA: hypothetical protein [Caudoviricetes sp.]
METKEYEKQLNIKEVRIGNIVYGSWDDQDEDGEDVIRYSLCKITGVDENGELGEGWSYMLENMESPDTDYYGGLYGVELNEDWLLNLGFEKVNYTFWAKGLAVHNHDIVSFYMLYEQNRTYIKYVHQLQNLYFALTGEELKIKES